MKKTVFLIMGLLIGMNALADDGIKVSPLTIAQGETADLEIVFECAEEKYIGYQFDVTAEGLEFDIDLDEEEGYDKGSALAKSHTIAASETASNSYRFLCSSNKNATIKAGSNVLMTISLKADAALEPGTYKVTISDIEFSKVSDNNHIVCKFDPVEATITITVPTAIKDQPLSPLPRGGELYNLQGQRISVNSIFSVPSVLPKGVNIVDGKKVMVK